MGRRDLLIVVLSPFFAFQLTRNISTKELNSKCLDKLVLHNELICSKICYSSYSSELKMVV